MRHARLLAACLLTACLPRGGEATDSAFTPDLPPPQITGLTWTCDVDAARWRVEVATDAWAGGAVLLWSADGTYVERHDGFRSVTAAPDGSSDLLRNDVAIVTDFRAARNGATAFSCSVIPSFLLWTRDLQGEVADCVNAGPSPELVLGTPTAPACERAWLDPAADSDAPAQ